MAFNVLDAYPITNLTHTERGLNTPNYRAKYLINTDRVVPPPLAVQAAAAAGIGTPPPLKGSSLIWNWDGNIYTDPSAYALDYTTSNFFSEENEGHWCTCEVTWRAPEQGADEQPASLGLPPLIREPEYWIEYGEEIADQYEAIQVLNIITGQLAAAPEVMHASNGEAMSPLQRSRLLPTFCLAKNVSSPLAALDRNDKFEDCINSVPFTLLGKQIAPHKARYVRSDVGQARYFQGFEYYRMVTRIELSRLPYYVERMNEGSFYKRFINGVSREFSQTDANGNMIYGPFNLKANGDLATTPAELTSKYYLRHQLADFQELTT